VSRSDLVRQFMANDEAAQAKEAEASAMFFEALAVPWWMPWKFSRLLGQAERLQAGAVLLREENLALAFKIEG
jgi:hypothetical protein